MAQIYLFRLPWANRPRQPHRARAPHTPTTPEWAALARLVDYALGDGREAQVVADFLLCWWASAIFDAFPLDHLWTVRPAVADDLLAVIGMLTRCAAYPDELDPRLHGWFLDLVLHRAA